MERKLRIADLFCCQGGAGRGWANAGFDVVGVDINYQHRYPYHFVQSDVFVFLKKNFSRFKFDAVHASPPCQRFSCLTPDSHKMNHPDYIDELREVFVKLNIPYIIENVSGARHKLIEPVMLCGSMFGLQIYRHRYFELGFEHNIKTPGCKHDFIPIIVSGRSSRLFDGKRKEFSVTERSLGLNVNWMSSRGLDEAIPPAYTEFIGKHLKEYIKNGTNNTATN